MNKGVGYLFRLSDSREPLQHGIRGDPLIMVMAASLSLFPLRIFFNRRKGIQIVSLVLNEYKSGLDRVKY